MSLFLWKLSARLTPTFASSTHPPLNGDHRHELEDPALRLLTMEMSSLSTSLQAKSPVLLDSVNQVLLEQPCSPLTRPGGQGRPQELPQPARLWASRQVCACQGCPPPWSSSVRGEKRKFWAVCVLPFLSQKLLLDAGCAYMRSNRWMDDKVETIPKSVSGLMVSGPPPLLRTAITHAGGPALRFHGAYLHQEYLPQLRTPLLLITKVSAFVGLSLPF